MSSFRSRTFVFIWLIKYLPTYIDGLQREKSCQHPGYCVTFNEDEIRAEAGLCAVIPCSFTTLFAPIHIIWYKCEPHAAKCDNSDPVFHSDKNKENIQPGFKGRVSLLYLNMTQNNCSMVINDLKKSDSGLYQLRVEGKETRETYTYLAKVNLSLTDLKQKASVMIPPLTEGQQATLTCTAPGLCSGSPPNITWMWRGTGDKDSYIIGNITALNTENLTAFTQRHVSTMTFKPSADHHNTNITCEVSFTGGITTEETVTLNVTFNHVKHCACGGGALPWAVAGVSLSVHIFSMIYLYHVWNTRKKAEPTEDDQTYMCMQKANASAEYDVIVQRPH